MRPVSHFGSFVAALALGLALGLALVAAGGVAYVASAPTIPAQDVIKPPVRTHTTARTLTAWTVPDLGNPDVIRATTPARAAARSSSWWTTATAR